MEHSGQMLLMVFLLAIFTSTSSGIQRSTTTALPGTVLKFTCECQGTVVLVFNDTFVANGNAVGDKTLADKNIFFERHESGSGSHNGYDIKIIASYENSGTYFMCIYQSGDCAASEHQISVIRDPPSPPESPTVSVKDNSTLAVSWTAPWSFPINHYTLRMINASSSELIGLWVTNHTELMVNKSWPSDCDLLVFTVEAFTDVGPSGPSEPTLTGFPTTIKGQKLDMKTRILEQASTEATIVTTFQVPDVCPYELISFTIVAHNQNPLSGSEIWGIVDVTKAEMVIRQVAMARPGDAFLVVLTVSNSLDEHLQQTNTVDIDIQT